MHYHRLDLIATRHLVVHLFTYLSCRKVSCTVRFLEEDLVGLCKEEFQCFYDSTVNGSKVLGGAHSRRIAGDAVALRRRGLGYFTTASSAGNISGKLGHTAIDKAVRLMGPEWNKARGSSGKTSYYSPETSPCRLEGCLA